MSKKTTRKALFGSVLALVLCVAMLVGTTFAWFTDEVNSTGNIIKAGKLDVEMTYSDTYNGTYVDASKGKIFDYNLWEPGYTDVKYVNIKNAGDLAFKYDLKLEAEETGRVIELDDGSKKTVYLSEVIDVYIGTEEIADRNDVTNMTYVGTLADLMADPDGAAYGVMYAGDSETYCIALHMQESAGNEYQELSVGDGIAVKLLAEQFTYEEDVFGSDYDANAGLPVAAIYRNPANENVPIDWIGFGFWQADTPYENYPLEAAYTFAATEENVAESPYKNWFCDFYVSLDRDLESNQIFLGGSYGGYLVGFNIDEDILGAGNSLPANTTIPLLGSVTGAGVSNWTYEAIVNGVQEFGCGVADINNALVGANFTVELRLINPDNFDDMLVISKVVYTFTDEVADAATLKTYLETGKDVVLAADIDLGDTQLTIPASVTVNLDLNGHTVSQSKECIDNYAMLSNNGNLTITGNGKLSFTDTGVGDTGSSWASYTVRNNGTLTIENGTIEHLGEQSGNMNNAIFHYSGSTTIKDGTISAPYSRSVRLWSGDITIGGGTYDGQVWVQPMNDSCKLTITGGSFKPATYGNDGSSVYVTNDEHDVDFSVSGGSFATKIGVAAPDKLVGCITGGTFTETAKIYTNTVLFAS